MPFPFFCPPLSLIANRYEVASRPLLGGMGVVYRCMDRDVADYQCFGRLSKTIKFARGLKRRVLLASCRPDQDSRKLSNMRNGLFGHYLLEDQHGQSAKLNGTGRVFYQNWAGARLTARPARNRSEST